MITNKLHYLFILLIITLLSCNVYKKKSYIDDRFKKGVHPQEATAMLIRDIEGDTLWARFGSRELRFMGAIREKYTGMLFYGRFGENKRILFSCYINKGVFNGNATRYYYNGKVVGQYYLLNGMFEGYMIIYYSNGQIMSISCRCNFKDVGLHKEYDRDGNLIKIEDYGDIPDSCVLYNEFLLENLPDSVTQGLLKK